MAELKWITKTKAVAEGSDTCDVVLSVSSERNKKVKAAYFTFHNGAEAHITDTQYMVCAVRGNKIYFKGANAGDGYKLTKASPHTTVLNVRIPAGLHEALKRHRGAYILFKDKELGLQYIELR